MRTKLVNLKHIGLDKQCGYWSSFENILSRLHAVMLEDILFTDSNFALSEAIGNLEGILTNYEENSPRRKTLWFVIEQLKLLKSSQLRYSNEMLIVAFTLYTASPHTYRDIRKNGLFILSHQKYLQHLVSSCNLNSPALSSGLVNYLKIRRIFFFFF